MHIIIDYSFCIWKKLYRMNLHATLINWYHYYWYYSRPLLIRMLPSPIRMPLTGLCKCQCKTTHTFGNGLMDFCLANDVTCSCSALASSHSMNSYSHACITRTCYTYIMDGRVSEAETETLPKASPCLETAVHVYWGTRMGGVQNSRVNSQM